MKALSESTKLKEADKKCKLLINILKGEDPKYGQISGDEQDNVLQDIKVLSRFTSGQIWQELINQLKKTRQFKPEKKLEVKNRFKSIVDKIIKSEIAKKWVMDHYDDEIIHILDLSLRRFNNFILPITVEVPDFISYDKSYNFEGESLTYRTALKKMIYENLPNRFKSSNKLVIIKYEQKNYPDYPEDLKERQERNLKATIYNPFDIKQIRK